MGIDEINEKIKELSALRKQTESFKMQRERELYEELIVPKLKEFNDKISDINKEEYILYKEKNRYYKSYVFGNEYIGNILARLFTECTGEDYKYYKRICYYYSLYGPNYPEERFLSSIISCFTPEENAFGRIETSAFCQQNLNSLVSFKEWDLEKKGYKLDRSWNPGYFVLDLYANDEIIFKHKENCYFNDTPERIFRTPYGEFVKELADRRFEFGEVSDKDVDDMIKSFAGKSREKQLKK